ncbi:MAG TPA: 50S ribosomal protein L9 [Cyclobacteriaceae bacterium]|jgi:large subunit ribosomal protein L9
MRVILKDDIKGLGYKNDIVTVKGGYGRNYLIPNGFAIVANKSNSKMIAENIRQAAHKAEKIKKDAEELAGKIGEMTIELGAKVGEKGKIFGSITAIQVSDALKDKGFNIDRKDITFKSQIKEVGDYEIILDLHKEVKHSITVKVAAE